LKTPEIPETAGAREKSKRILKLAHLSAILKPDITDNGIRKLQ
jgi:hypothetical protein